MSDTRTNQELAEIAHYGISRYCDECPLVACGPGDDCHAAVDELVRRADDTIRALVNVAKAAEREVEDSEYEWHTPTGLIAALAPLVKEGTTE